jgi:hypothetical protein
VDAEIERWRTYFRERRADGGSARREHPSLLALVGLLESFRESYLVATRTVAAVEEWPIARTGLFRAMRREYATGLLLGELRKPEGNSVVTFGNALERLLAMRVVQAGSGKQARWIEPGPAFGGIGERVRELEV